MQDQDSIRRRDLEVAWAAGLFEGEGCFGSYPRGRKHGTQARLSMTDRDVVERFAKIVGMGTVRGPVDRGNKEWKPIWEWYVQRASEVRAVVALFRPWLGERRLARGFGS